MKGKYIKWVVVCLAASIMAGAVTFYYIKPYIWRANPFQHLTKPNQNTEEAEKIIPFPDWQDGLRQRALAVIIDNTEEARPQAGLEKAEVIVEFPVEGGLTRLLAIMSVEDIELIGPIRSARPYFVDIAQEYNGILVHAGGSMEALAQIENSKINHLDEILGGTQVGAAFWRVTERPKPYNLYASSDSLRRAAKNLKYNLTTPPLERTIIDAETEVGGEETGDITIFYPNRTSLVRYMFNKKTQVFERYMEEKPHLTVKGEQITAANVIIQFVPYRGIDGDGRLQLIMHGEGQALIFREGKVIKGMWQKSPGQFTKYTDNKGKVLPMMQGPTWIEIVPKGTRVEY